ncbi:MAG: c-type cytochrome [Chloroflexi bacterium]|nr:c-type cytochrome [Chloroflexota bacterium]
MFIRPAWASPTPQETPPPPTAPAQMAVPQHPLAIEGKRVYSEFCASCHGTAGDGQGPAAKSLPNQPTAFSDPQVINTRSPRELFQTTKEGRMDKGMPPWGVRLDDVAIWGVTAYLFDLGLTQDVYDAGAQIYKDSCAVCHGESGKGDGPQAQGDMPDLSSWAAWVDISNDAWAQRVKQQDVHASVVKELDDDSLKKVMAYVRTLSYESTRAPLEGNGIISGTVEMMTKGEEANFEGLTVALFGLRGGEELALTLTTTVKADNTFRFEGLSTSHQMIYYLETEWEGVPYATDALVFLPGQTVITTTLQVAATTEEDPGIRAGRAHWFMDFDGETLTVGELIGIDNPGDRAYIGTPLPDRDGARAVIRWALPAGVMNLRLDGGKLGERFLLVNGELIDTLPLPPGRDVRRLLLQYQLPIEHNQAVLAHPVSLPIDLLTVFIADRGEHIEVPDNATEGESQDVNGVPFKMYTLTRVDKGETVTFRLTNLAAARKANPHEAPPSLVRQIGVGLSLLLGLLLLGSMVYLTRRRKPSEDETKEALRERREEILRLIAQLDIAFEAGEVDEATYREERDILMAEAVQLTRMLGDIPTELEGSSDTAPSADEDTTPEEQA